MSQKKVELDPMLLFKTNKNSYVGNPAGHKGIQITNVRRSVHVRAQNIKRVCDTLLTWDIIIPPSHVLLTPGVTVRDNSLYPNSSLHAPQLKLAI